MPVPVRFMVCGLSAALSVIVTAPLRVPVAVGVNLTLIWQLDPAASDDLHVVVREKAPLVAMLMIFSAAVPVLVRVTVCAALVVSTLWEANVKLVVERLTIGIVPVPERVTVCGLLLALSETVIAPDRSPVVVGVNVMLIVQFPPAATEVPQVLLCAYCVLAAMLVILSAAVPVFVSVKI